MILGTKIPSLLGIARANNEKVACRHFFGCDDCDVYGICLELDGTRMLCLRGFRK